MKKGPIKKFINPQTGKIIILPMDHGVSDGPIKGLINMRETIKKAKEGGVDAIVVHKGVYKNLKKAIGNLPTFIHVSASTSMGEPLKKVLIATPLEVKNLGAQGVSIHLNIGNKYESEMLKDLGKISRECAETGLPLLAMMYPRNKVNEKIITFTDPERISHAARIAYELGADIVKVPYTGSAESFKKVVESVPIPVVIAGGAKGNEEEMLNSIRDCLFIGAGGVSIGRNIFQADDMIEMIKKIKKLMFLNK